MTQVMHGIVHGKTIKLDQEVGVPVGQEVEVTIRIIPGTPRTEPWGEGLRRCAGALADEWTEEDDRIWGEIYQSRRHGTSAKIILVDRLLDDEQQIEAEDDYRICVRRGSDEEAKPKKKRRRMNEDDE